MKALLLKCIVLKADLLQDRQIYCLQACMGALFSPENRQAGAVKGLILSLWYSVLVNGSCRGDTVGSSSPVMHAMSE